MPGRLNLVAVADPYRLGALARQYLSRGEKAPLTEDDQKYAPLDQRRYRLEPENYRTEYWGTKIGELQAVRVADRSATQLTIRSPATSAFWVAMFERGASRVILPGSDEPVFANSATGLIRGDEPGTLSATSDDSSRIGLWIPAGLLHRRLEALLDGQRVESLAFQPMFDLRQGAGATIRRMLGWLFAELEQSDSLLANEIASRSFAEHFMLFLLLGLPHSHSASLHRHKTAAAPGNVKRAEEFMRTNVCVPLTLEAIADAAGCSVRSLQIAFRRFRGTTPMAAFQRMRLAAARAEILRVEQAQSLTRIAGVYGFSNPSRFAQLFRRTYGTLPSEALRARRDPLVEESALMGK
jgi:AraC-like DNA-binding protein